MATKFYIDKRPNKKGEVLIRCRVSIHGESLLTTLGIAIPQEVWNNKTQRVRGSEGVINSKGSKAKDINLKISQIETYFKEIENKLERKARPDLKKLFTERFGKGPKQAVTNSFIQVYEKFTTSRGKINDWTPATFEKFEALRKQILAYKDNPSFEDFNTDGLAAFVEFLRFEGNLRNSTIEKKLGFLKWFLKWAEAEGFNTVTDYKTFRPKLKATNNKIVFLERDELLRLFNFDFPEQGQKVTLTHHNGDTYEKEVMCERKTMEQVRDVFCFCCFTSLRYSDVANLRRQNIHGDRITITTVKTADTLDIELNQNAKIILKRYEDARFPFDKVLPVISNQRMNEHLKLMGELCGINEPVTEIYYKGNERCEIVKDKWEKLCTHTARRTFISNALMSGIPPQTVMKWTGHSDYKAMKPYIEISNKAKAEAMSKLDNYYNNGKNDTATN